MDKNSILILLFVFIIPSILYLNTPNFFGYDSYYFLTKVCEPDRNHYNSYGLKTWGEELVLTFLPCQEVLLKVMLVILFLISLLALYLIGELINKGFGIFVVLFANITNFLLLRSFYFENDAFGIPLLYFGLYFVLKSKEKLVYLFFGMFLISIGSLLWNGGVYYLLVFSLLTPLIFPVFLAILLMFGLDLLTNLVPSYAVLEQNPLLGANYFLFYGIFFLLAKNQKYHFRIYLIIFSFLGLLNPKLFILAIPFLGIAAAKVFNEFGKNKQILFYFSLFLVVLNLFSLFFVGVVGPKPYEHDAVKDLLRISEDLNKPYLNDWEYGHLIWYYGGETEFHSGFPHPNYEERTEGKLILSRFPQMMRCHVIHQYDTRFDGTHLRLWKC